MLKWQKTQRLLGSADRNWIVDHILLDSLLFARLLPANARAILDVGSGAGVPGVPLKIVMPEVAITLLEARARRVSFLSAVVRELELGACDVLNARLEGIETTHRGRYDALVMRCAGDPLALLDASLPLLRCGGMVIASGPPRRRPVARGRWLDVDGPTGRRLFWVHET